jgi:putative membrane protein
MTPIDQSGAVPSSAAPAEGKPAPHTSDHLANERTFLAWVRTSISVIGLGFVVAKFSVWLRELGARLGDPIGGHRSGLSLPLGLGMMGVGGLLSIIAAWRYRAVHRAIEQGQPAADQRTVVVVTLLIVAMAAALIIYMLQSR